MLQEEGIDSAKAQGHLTSRCPKEPVKKQLWLEQGGQIGDAIRERMGRE